MGKNKTKQNMHSVKRQLHVLFVAILLIANPVVGSEEVDEKKDDMNHSGLVGALLGFPLGYATGQTTMASSGETDPSAGLAQGMAGAAAGYLIASGWDAKKEKEKDHE